jgi:uncharacterized membrane protein
MAKSSNENVMGLLAYLGGFVTGIIFLLIEKKNKFVRFHAMQSIIVFGGIFVLEVAFNIIYIPALSGLIQSLLSLLSLVLWILLMVKAYQGKMYKLPTVGDIAEKQVKGLK